MSLTKNPFNISLRAKEDLRNIWWFTFDVWGEAQADNYIAKMFKRFDWLAKNPQGGKHRVDVKKGYYSHVQGSHVIFYIMGENSVDIIGIPHKSMDILNYFDKEQ